MTYCSLDNILVLHAVGGVSRAPCISGPAFMLGVDQTAGSGAKINDVHRSGGQKDESIKLYAPSRPTAR